MSGHVIETLQWSCHSDTREDAVTTQQRLRDFILGEGSHLLERLLDRLSSRDRVWRIDQLDIDLGDLPVDADPSVWARHLELALDTALRRIRQGEDEGTPSGSPAGDRDLDNFLYYVRHGRLHWSMPSLAHASLADWLSHLTRRCGPRLWPALLRLPHPERAVRRLSQITPHHGLHALLSVRHEELAGALEELDALLLEPLRAQGRLSGYQLAQMRMTWRVAGLHALWTTSGSHLGVTRLQRLMDALRDSLLTGAGKGDASEWAQRLRSISSGRDPTGLRRRLFLGLERRFLDVQSSRIDQRIEGSPPSAGTPETQDRKRADALPAAWYESMRQFALRHQSDARVRDAGLGLSALQIYLLDYSLAYLDEAKRPPQDHVAWHGVWREALDVLGIDEEERPFAVDARTASETHERPRVTHGRRADGTVSPADDHPGSEAIYIANAGLVLLANYAPRLFAMLGLTRDDAFIDMAAQHRAVHCLVYLSDGHAGSEEHEWVLNKMLCGLSMDEPVPPAPPLDTLVPVLDSLLPAIVAHWRALGQTSPHGLRQTFLRRIGRLVEHETFDGGHRRLKVQPNPFDVLLDRLPWSYGTIRLPWMKEVLHVEWR
ncbi:contractile injection system tape measure protein [Luteibacter sp. CQ10]|uniref:contractile injection system tape measure protein n=1 Tax=Luteibacter sp. CQ10 TaxID=2805821 RepID=UPI0034A16357